MQLAPLNPGDYIRIESVVIRPSADESPRRKIDRGIVISSEPCGFMGKYTRYGCTILSDKTQDLVRYDLEFPIVSEVIHEAR